jgi:hypothetical protein
MKNTNFLVLAMSVFIALAIMAPAASAVTIKTETTNKVFESAKLVKSVTIQNDDKSESVLNAVSHGLRKKTVFGMVPVSVYVLQVLAAKPEKLVRTPEGFLASVKEAGPVQLHFTFSRNLPGEKISSSFKDGLEANEVNVKTLSKELSQALSQISEIKEFKEGQNFSITFLWAGDNATTYITDPTLKISTITGPKEFADQLLSIWFGKTADSRLEDLKQTLVK